MTPPPPQVMAVMFEVQKWVWPHQLPSAAVILELSILCLSTAGCQRPSVPDTEEKLETVFSKCLEVSGHIHTNTKSGSWGQAWGEDR